MRIDLTSPIRNKHGRLKDKKPVKAETIRRREYQRKRYQDKKEHIDKINAQWKRDNLERRHWHEAKRRYGVTFDQYQALMKEDCGICGISRNDSDKKFAIDHCHKSEHELGVIKIRGVLCHNCNKGLGSLQDDIGILFKAIKYLGRFTN
jgi:hypothetical protein